MRFSTSTAQGRVDSVIYPVWKMKKVSGFPVSHSYQVRARENPSAHSLRLGHCPRQVSGDSTSFSQALWGGAAGGWLASVILMHRSIWPPERTPKRVLFKSLPRQPRVSIPITHVLPSVHVQSHSQLQRNSAGEPSQSHSSSFPVQGHISGAALAAGQEVGRRPGGESTDGPSYDGLT